MRKVPRISESESRVVRVLWEKAPQTANEVVEALSGSTSWKPKTIKTLLNRLVQKGAIGFNKKGRQYHYFPLVRQDECIAAETRTFLSRFSPGALRPMLVAFLESESLSPEEIEELRSILDEKRGE